jgi:hypothetical protein
MEARAGERTAATRRVQSIGRSSARVVALLVLARAGGAQLPQPADTLTTRPTLLGSPAEDRERIAQLLGTRDGAGTLLRSPSASRVRDAATVVPLAPDVRVVWNEAQPFGGNEGSLWPGRGVSALVRGGGALEVGRVRVVLLPELTVSQNRAFDFRPSTTPGQSAFASPWWNGRGTIDLPTRFGDRAWWLASLGQSSVTVRARNAAFGVATENEWWGPGIRNALLLSNAAEGFPHAFARTARPWRTPLGDVEARLLLGVLTSSLYFDTVPNGSYRSFDALGVTLRPAIAPHLTVGVARSVVRTLASRGDAAGHALDAIVSWEPTPTDATEKQGADYYTSLFARWLSPEGHFEVYGELANEATRGLRELLLAPHEGQALTLGAQVLTPLGARAKIRWQAEFSTVEQSIALRDRPVAQPFYTGLGTREGYTYRGRLLGASFGPGGSAQWLAADAVNARGRLGLALGRVRWNNDALSDQPNANFFRHDVTGYVAVRGAVRARYADVAADVYWSRRDNYLFQNGVSNPGGLRTVDVPNLSLALGVTPR